MEFCRRFERRGAIQRRLAIQLFDAGTSIGANLEEAAGGQTKPDFIAKNFVAFKEARETRYWLRLARATEASLEQEISPLLQEANEFVAMLTTLLIHAKSNPHRGDRP